MISCIPEGKVVLLVIVADGPSPLSLNGVIWNVYSVLGMRPEAVNVLISVPFILEEAEDSPKVTS